MVSAKQPELSQPSPRQPMSANPAPEALTSSVLVVDDERDVTDLVAYHLRAKGLRVATLNDPNQIMGVARTFQPDLVILDVMMPELNGTQICRMLRADPVLKHTPIFFLSARADEPSRVTGLEAGADDFICKPFSIKELVLKVTSVLRRIASTSSQSTTSVISVGRINLDSGKHTVEVCGLPIELTATEFKLLQVLMERKGRVLSREYLLTNVWNYENEIETRTVDTHVRRLREKLASEAVLIETVRGVGYRMMERPPDSCST